jgi:hypothetical protein
MNIVVPKMSSSLFL